MNRRCLLTGLAVLTALPRAAARDAEPSDARPSDVAPVEVGGMTFAWHHRDGRLRVNVSAPAPGWLTVGFNDQDGLAQTWLIMAALVLGRLHVEEHVALPPHHRTVAELGGHGLVADVDGSRRGARTLVAFSLPHDGPGRFAKPLGPGTTTHLVLAWSHETDFAHHSAWRGHRTITL